MGKRKKNISEQQVSLVTRLVRQMPVKDVAKELGISPSGVYKICRLLRIETKAFKDPVLVKDKPKPKIKRPPAEYSNTGFISVTQKYAS